MVASEKQEDSWLNFIMIGATALLLFAFIGYVLHSILQLPKLESDSFPVLALLVLVGLGAFIGIMNFLSFSAQWIGITDARQPFGLPEGTVRAILTIAFIVLVGVLASFLLTQSGARVVFNKQPITIESLGTTEAQALQQKLSAEALVVLDSISVAAGAPPRSKVLIYTRNDYRLADDVAKQILTILSTILAAMIGFYFGARPTEGARSDDSAERSRLLADLNTRLQQPPTLQTVTQKANDQLVNADEAKKTKINGIKATLVDIQQKVGAAQTSLADTSQPIEKVRAAQAVAKTALEKLADLNKQLDA